MKVKIFNEYGKNDFCRCIELIPSFTFCLYKNFKVESFRISWLGFTIGIYKKG